MRATVTFSKTSSPEATEHYRKLYDEIAGIPWFHLHIWNVPILLRELEAGLPGAIKRLDDQMKGWKPVADGTECLHGMNANGNHVEYWYQRTYTK